MVGFLTIDDRGVWSYQSQELGLYKEELVFYTRLVKEKAAVADKHKDEWRRASGSARVAPPFTCRYITLRHTC